MRSPWGSYLQTSVSLSFPESLTHPPGLLCRLNEIPWRRTKQYLVYSRKLLISWLLSLERLCKLLLALSVCFLQTWRDLCSHLSCVCGRSLSEPHFFYLCSGHQVGPVYMLSFVMRRLCLAQPGCSVTAAVITVSIIKMLEPGNYQVPRNWT